MKITRVEPRSIAEEIGIRPGDTLLEMNNHRVMDAIDYRFYEGDRELSLKIAHGSDVVIYEIEKDEDEPVGLEFEEMKTLSCGNDCIFCFVDQNPKGLRSQLYFRDGDYRLSFMYGNYTTMTNAGPATLERIIRQRLSPQYISVHVTDSEIRKRLMGLKRDDAILEKIKRLHDGGIDMHAQIVLCPGINDGKALSRTVDDLYRFKAHILSLAIVPVGLTDHRLGLHELQKVDPAYARDLVGTVTRWQKKFRSEIARGFVYASDEFFILAGRSIPPARHYDGYPQTENGVGMVRMFLQEFTKQSRGFPKRLRTPRKMTLATGELAAGFMAQEIVPRLRKVAGLNLELKVVPNLLFGRSVTVAGLLSGKCLYSALAKKELGDLLLLPPDLLNADGLFLDGATIPQLEEQLGVPISVFGGDWTDVFSVLDQQGRRGTSDTLLRLPERQQVYS